MANDRNISALVQVLRGAPGLPAGIPLEALAQHLAAAGVLYPAALTDEQAVKLGADAVGSIPTEPTEIALCVREGLERIARGPSRLLGPNSGPSQPPSRAATSHSFILTGLASSTLQPAESTPRNLGSAV
jgi:hypothetical protein